MEILTKSLSRKNNGLQFSKLSWVKHRYDAKLANKPAYVKYADGVIKRIDKKIRRNKKLIKLFSIIK